MGKLVPIWKFCDETFSEKLSPKTKLARASVLLF